MIYSLIFNYSEALTCFENEFARRSDSWDLEAMFDKIRDVLLMEVCPNTSIMDEHTAKLIVEKLRKKDKTQFDPDEFIVKNVDWLVNAKDDNFQAHYAILKERLFNFLQSNDLPNNIKAIEDISPIADRQWVVFARITRDTSNTDSKRFLLEDDTEAVAVNLKRSIGAPFLICNTVVLATLVYNEDSNMFVAHDIKYPPTAINATPPPSAPISRLSPDSRIVFVRQVYLDDSDAFDMLKVMLTGFSK